MNSRSDGKRILYFLIIFIEYITFQTDILIESCLSGALPSILANSLLYTSSPLYISLSYISSNLTVPSSSVRLNPPIQVSQFDSAIPFASSSRRLGSALSSESTNVTNVPWATSNPVFLANPSPSFRL